MWSTILLNAVLSIIIIIIVNQIWEYCKVNYTTQKTKNLVETQTSKYKQIAEDMERNINAVSVVVKPDEPNNNSPVFPVKLRRTPLLRSAKREEFEDSVSAAEESFRREHVGRMTRSDFIPEEEKKWVHSELTNFIDTL